MRSGWTVKGTVASLLIIASWSASAQAGKYCGDRLEGGKASGPTQKEAVEAAQQWWSSRAGALGSGYQNWDNADDRALECKQDGRGQFECRATARPCLPEGTLPDNLPKLDM